MTSPLPGCAAFVRVLMACLALLHVAPSVAAGFDDAARLVVMIESQIEEQTHQGAGVVFSVDGDSAYVFTANHLLRKGGLVARQVDVYFRDAPQKPVAAQLLSHVDAGADLAVLEVRGLRSAGLGRLGTDKALPLDLFGSSEALRRGAPAYPIGNPGGIGWGAPIKPDAIDRRSAEQILFQSAYVAQGHSGGGLFDADWRLIGMVLAVAQAPTVAALPIEAIIGRLNAWGLRVGFLAQGTGQATAAAAPAAASAEVVQRRALVQAFDADGRPFVRATTWGAITQEVADRWATLSISPIQGLPPVPGRPDFTLVLTSPEGDDLRFHVSDDGRPLTTAPIPAVRLEDAALRVIDVFFLRRDDEITEPLRLTARQLFAGQALRLRYTDDALRKVRDKTAQRDVRLFVQAHAVAPEAGSGADRSPASPTLVPRSRVYDDSVDFSSGDATDHLTITPDRQPCRGLLLLKAEGSVVVTSSPAGDGDEASTPSATRLARNANGATLFGVDCTRPGLLRIQAANPGSKATYMIHAGRGERDPKAAVTLVQRWLETWPLPNSMDAAPADQNVAETRRGIDAILQRTAGGAAELVAAYQAYLQSFAFAQRAAFLTPLLALDGDALQPALATCCKDAEALRFLLNLLRAEAGSPFDRNAVAWGRRFTPPFEQELESRVTKVLGPAPAKK